MRRRRESGNAPVPTAAPAGVLARPRFEVLPLRGVLEETGTLPEHTVVTVTASPRRGTEATVELCEKLAAQRLRPVPHLAARQLTGRGELIDVLDRLAGAGVDDVFVVGGDTPEPAGPYPDGAALLREMADLGRLPAEVGVPSYPEGHPSIDDATLWASLRSKQDLATYTVTQLCFDLAAIREFLRQAGEHGITLPVVIGVAGAVDVTTLARVGSRIGVGDSLRFLTSHRSIVGRLLRPRRGRDAVLRGVVDLAARPGEPTPAGVHCYTFNKVRATARMIADLSAATGGTGGPASGPGGEG
ncbi:MULTISPECIES: methylenetetrahydrofolate reductase [Prauserella salsuginis group]|uniref:Methylenetetrahydrofolate reductase n=1 Tax=Prauserella salsuginis TaxID=387889 RepID=A0ABW6GBG9_9PSEU|nr:MULTISPECIES: methylenetetrahydrofolate reductase [Prauserella salsuginis group]MCR3722862.1 methylenetetrahydrofolate reductase (NADPH) [Prauserella flava]MCR3737463.1 methylenetetrahydrofolate reductase (NADPH) [Prauserella salsuginis]